MSSLLEELKKILSQSVGCYFVLLTVSFVLQKLFSFMRSHLLIVDLSAWAICILFRKLSAVQIDSRLFSAFCFIRFSLSAFVLMSLIHLDLSFVGDKHSLFAFFYMLISKYSSTISLRCFIFFRCIFLASLSKIRCL